MNETNLDMNVVLSVLRLSRAMRRCPPPRQEHAFPPAVGRLLGCVAANPGVSSRELCEALDVRPSSLSEMLARAEGMGLLSRAADETDRRVQRVSLTEKGQAAVREIEEAPLEDARKKAACLTEEEKKQFCALCGKLCLHISSLALDLPGGPRPFPGDREDPDGPPPPERDGFPEQGPGRPVPPGKRFRC